MAVHLLSMLELIATILLLTGYFSFDAQTGFGTHALSRHRQVEIPERADVASDGGAEDRRAACCPYLTLASVMSVWPNSKRSFIRSMFREPNINPNSRLSLAEFTNRRSP